MPTRPDRPVLAAVPRGTSVALTDLDVAPATRRRLAEFGLRPGARVTVVSRSVGGGRIVAVGHARIALDRATARRLAVTPAA